MMRTLIRVIITLLIIIFIFWNRLIRERVPKDLNVIISHSNNIFILIITILILINCLSLLLSFKHFIYKDKEATFIQKLFNITIIKKFKNIINYIMNTPRELYEEISDRYNIFTKEIEMSASYLVAYYNSTRNQYIFLIALIYLPRIIVVTTFIIDIFFFNKFHYFYISVTLLVIPLITKIYLHMVFWQSKLMYEYSEFFLDITPTPDGVIINLKKTPVRDKTIKWMIEKFDVLCDFWHIGTKLNNVHYWITVKDEKIAPYITLYTSLCYIIGWSYILYLIINTYLYP